MKERQKKRPSAHQHSSIKNELWVSAEVVRQNDDEDDDDDDDDNGTALWGLANSGDGVGDGARQATTAVFKRFTPHTNICIKLSSTTIETK